MASGIPRGRSAEPRHDMGDGDAPQSQSQGLQIDQPG